MRKPASKGFMKDQFDWDLYPQAEKFLEKHVAAFLKKNSVARSLAKRMERETSTRFFDWIDHLVLPEASVRELEQLGFEEKKSETEGERVFTNHDTIWFPVLLGKGREIALKPERLDHFLQMMGKGQEREGEMFAPYRKSIIHTERGVVLSAVERRGYDGFVVNKGTDVRKYKEALEAFFCRQRYFASDKEGMDATLKLVKQFTGKLASARVADAFFRTERVYWQRRNRPGQVQKSRQDRLGLGWGNHDHHTYRSSREEFIRLIKIFEAMGYNCREQFHAGEKAGWGAQILEHPVCNIIVFSDVDLTIQEKEKDFAHRELQHRKELGTVGLWIGLHGESMLQAGMHHLEARFEFEKLRTDLKKININTLPPFSDFPFLKQAFVQSEFWQIEKKRLDSLLKAGSITRTQYKQFLSKGARGSHLENLQRRQGFKGFNQDSVSAIITVTDPRKMTIKGA